MGRFVVNSKSTWPEHLQPNGCTSCQIGPAYFKVPNIERQIGSGTGYPVFSRNGDAGQKWLMGEIDLDSEYTSHPFTVSRLSSDVCVCH